MSWAQFIAFVCKSKSVSLLLLTKVNSCYNNLSLISYSPNLFSRFLLQRVCFILSHSLIHFQLTRHKHKPQKINLNPSLSLKTRPPTAPSPFLLLHLTPTQRKPRLLAPHPNHQLAHQNRELALNNHRRLHLRDAHLPPPPLPDGVQALGLDDQSVDCVHCEYGCGDEYLCALCYYLCECFGINIIFYIG